MSEFFIKRLVAVGSQVAERGSIPPAPFVDLPCIVFDLNRVDRLGETPHDLRCLPWRMPPGGARLDDPLTLAHVGYHHICVPGSYFATSGKREIKQMAERICGMYAVAAAYWLEEVAKIGLYSPSALDAAIVELTEEVQAVTERLVRVQAGPNRNEWAEAFLSAWVDACEAYIQSGFTNDSASDRLGFKNTTEFDPDAWNHWFEHLVIYSDPKKQAGVVHTYPMLGGGVRIWLDGWANRWHAKARILNNCESLGA